MTAIRPTRLRPALVAIATLAALPAQAADAPAIVGIEARLFYEQTATFSPDILAGDGFTLWNTPIGEGSAEGWSNAVLVLFRVSGPPGTTPDAVGIEMEARYDVSELDPAGVPAARENVLREREPLCHPGAEGQCFHALWLRQTGCGTVTVTARLTGAAGGEDVSEAIAFECGE